MLGDSVSLGDSSDSGSNGHVIQYVLFGLLAGSAVRNYV